MSREPLIYIGIFIGVLVLVEGHLSGRLRQVDQPQQPRQPPARDARQRAPAAKRCWNKLRKEMDQHMKARSIPLYSLLADKAQKAEHRLFPATADHDDGSALACGLPRPDHRHRRLASRSASLWRSAWASAASTSGSTQGQEAPGMIEEQLPDAVELMVRSLARRPSVLVGHQHRRQGNRRTRWPPSSA
jgi:tight adherence protein B